MESHHKWNDYYRSHRDFILATLFEPDRVHTAAGDVLCGVDEKLLEASPGEWSRGQQGLGASSVRP